MSIDNIRYSLVFEHTKTIYIYQRIPDIKANRIQGTKDLAIAKIKYTNKKDIKKIQHYLSLNNCNLFSLLDNIKLTGKIIINTIV